MRLFSLLFCLIAACGNAPQKTFDVPSEFMSYYQSFSEAGSVTTDNLIIQFGPLDYPRVGQCWTGPTTPIITIEPNYWGTVSELQKKEIIWHELGHCVLGRAHRTDFLSDGWPASIMYPTQFDPNYIFNQNYEYYRKELFGE